MRLNSRQRSRRGSILVLYAGLFFGILAIAAVTIDLGSAKLTQRLMQSAVDTAAMEGLRSGPEQASNIVAIAFDDDLDPSNDVIGYGAGPIISTTGGVGADADLAADQLIKIDTSNRVYKPQRSDGTPGLELNSANQPEGDIVRGQFNPNVTAGEDGSYSRTDFDPTATTTDSLLVRMRRANKTIDQQAGISSSGPTLPFLFGRGSMMQPSPSGYNPRTDGITVRATAIAQFVPAKTVGMSSTFTGPDGAVTIRGLPPVVIALRWDYWALPTAMYPTPYWQNPGTPPTDRSQTLSNTSGVLMVTATSRPPDWPAGQTDLNTVGRVIDLTQVHDANGNQRTRWHSGDALPAATTTPPTTDGSLVYVILYQTIDTTDYVIGFGTFKVTTDANAGTITLTRQPGDMVPLQVNTYRSVSAAVLQRPDSTFPIDATVNQLFTTNNNLRGQVDANGQPIALLTPALVR